MEITNREANAESRPAEPMGSTPPSPPDDGIHEARSLGEHLRTVHFALLTICLLLLGAVLQYKQPPLSRAITNVKDMAALAAKEAQINKALMAKGHELFENTCRLKSIPTQRGRPVYVYGKWTDGAEGAFELTYAKNWVGRRAPRDWEEEAFFYKAETIGQFAAYWDSLMYSSILPIPDLTTVEFDWYEWPANENRMGKTLALALTLDSFQSQLQLPNVLATSTSTPVQPTRLPLHVDQYWLKTNTIGGSREIQIHLPMERAIPVDLQQEFIDAAGHRRDWKRGLFAQSFGELETQRPAIFSLTFADALEYLRRRAGEQAAKEDNVELFGAKLPLSTIGDWGTIVLLGIQIYLIISLVEFKRRFVARRSIVANWIGMYGSLPAVVFSVFTCCFLPVIMIVTLCVRAWDTDHSLGKALRIAAAVVSVFVSFGLARFLIYFGRVQQEQHSKLVVPDLEGVS